MYQNAREGKTTKMCVYEEREREKVRECFTRIWGYLGRFYGPSRAAMVKDGGFMGRMVRIVDISFFRRARVSRCEFLSVFVAGRERG